MRPHGIHHAVAHFPGWLPWAWLLMIIVIIVVLHLANKQEEKEDFFREHE